MKPDISYSLLVSKYCTIQINDFLYKTRSRAWRKSTSIRLCWWNDAVSTMHVAGNGVTTHKYLVLCPIFYNLFTVVHSFHGVTHLRVWSLGVLLGRRSWKWRPCRSRRRASWGPSYPAHGRRDISTCLQKGTRSGTCKLSSYRLDTLPALQTFCDMQSCTSCRLHSSEKQVLRTLYMKCEME